MCPGEQKRLPDDGRRFRSVLLLTGRYGLNGLRSQWWSHLDGGAAWFGRRAVAGPQLGALDRSDKFAADWRFRLHLNERLVADRRYTGLRSSTLSKCARRNEECSKQ